MKAIIRNYGQNIRQEIRIIDEKHNILFERINKETPIPEEFLDVDIYWHHNSLICDDGIIREVFCLYDQK